MTVKLYLFTQEGCRPCMFAEGHLKRTEGWEQYVEVIDVSKPINRSYVEKYELKGTPSLVAVRPDGLHKIFTNPHEMTKTFWNKLFENLNSRL